MKASSLKPMLCVVAAGMLASGCAAVNPDGKTVVRQEIDRDYVAAVERSARGMPVAVIWVNPPTKRVEHTAETN
jgi:hypothetical protein